MVQLEELAEVIQMQTVSVPLQLSDSTVTGLASTKTVPPRVVGCGYSRKMQAWAGADAGEDRVGFRPAHSYTPGAPKVRVSHVAIDGPILIAADNAKYGTLTIWECNRWTELQKIQVADEAAEGEERKPASVACLTWDGEYLAIGTHQGEVRTWKQPGKNSPYVKFLNPLKVDKVPIYHVHLAGRELLAAYSSSKSTMVVWKLEDGKLQHAWNAEKLAAGRALTHSVMAENLIASIHQTEGAKELPSVQLLDALTGDGGQIPVGELTIEDGDAKCLAFDTFRVVVGFSSGAVIGWEVGSGYKCWKRYHGGEVGCVAMVPPLDRTQPSRILTGGADRRVCLWDPEGGLIGRVELGGQITRLDCNQDKFASVGTNRGFVEVIMLPGAETTDRLDISDMQTRPKPPIEYDILFEDGGSEGPLRQKDHMDKFMGQLVEDGLEGVLQGGLSSDPAPATTSTPSAKNEEKETEGSGKASANGLKGAFSKKSGTGLVTKEEDERMEKEKENMGTSRPEAADMPGTARDANFNLNQELKCCASLTCNNKEVPGLKSNKKFLRCGRCKQVYYCSQHCQRTHWRDEHKRKCCADQAPQS